MTEMFSAKHHTRQECCDRMLALVDVTTSKVGNCLPSNQCLILQQMPGGKVSADSAIVTNRIYVSSLYTHGKLKLVQKRRPFQATHSALQRAVWSKLKTNQ